MKQIPLTQGKFALVDDADFEWLNQWKWCVAIDKKYDLYYARKGFRCGKKKTTQQMHRLILHASKAMSVDHINHNGLDNRRCNLRLCNASQNQCNQKSANRNSTSKYKGVCWDNTNKKWLASLQFKKRHYHLGHSSTEVECAKLYDKKAKELFGVFASLNFSE